MVGTKPEGTARPRRARSARAFATDRQVLDGAASVILSSGWDSLTVLSCAKAAGLSSKAVNDRHASVSALGVAVWRDGIGESLHQAIVDVLESMLPSTSDEAVDSRTGERAFGLLARPSDSLIIAVELLGAAVFDAVLRQALSSDLSTWLAPWCAPKGKVTASRAAQSTYLVVAALGLLFAFRRPYAVKAKFAGDVEALVRAFANPAKPMSLPKAEAAHMRLDPPGPVNDEHDALLAATILEVAANGYPAATLVRIMAATDSTEGLLYSRYASKIELFIAAVNWRTENGLMVNLNWFRGISEKIGPGAAEAVLWREYMRPEHQLGRGLAIEQIRTGWREPALQEVNDAAEATFAKTLMASNPSLTRAEALSKFHWDISLGYGAELLPSFLPDAWKLPFEVVTVPLLDAPDADALALGYLSE
jgi:AcrR family transcriptional regulator